MKDSLILLNIALVSFLLTELSVSASSGIVVRPPSLEKCMDELGCFSINPPFFDFVERPISLLPDNRGYINTKFLLYTPTSSQVPTTFSNILGNVEDILETNFNSSVGTKFVVPGYRIGGVSEWKEPLVQALLDADGSNVFLVDWGNGDGPIYEQAVANSRVVGAEIAHFITLLQDIVGIEPESIHLIGHSLGAHIMGYAGKRLKNLGRITGLDPAGPYFTNVDPIVRLDRSDALLVDVIHTNAAATLFHGFGIKQSLGHFDFYPNGGYLQPGCKDNPYAIFSFFQHPISGPDLGDELSCNHMRAIELFLSSLRNNEGEMLGVVCDNLEDFNSGKCGTCSGDNPNKRVCIPLGMRVDQYASLKKQNESINLYLNTTEKEPYFM